MIARTAGASARQEAIEFGGVTIKPGTRHTIELPLPRLYTHATVGMPVHVIHGRQQGPQFLLTAAVHGDEINGIEIIRRVLATKAVSRLAGTLFAVPVVNTYGFLSQSRYLPDRRDLNRSFPGSDKGSMAARLADTFMTEVASRCTHGIDLHTAAAGRTNLPQIRADLDRYPQLSELAEAFAAPIVLDSATRPGTLREAIGDKPVLLYEAGEALRFDDLAIRVGVKGVLRVMRHLGMLPPVKTRDAEKETGRRPWFANNSVWVRASQSGILRARIKLGGIVEEGDILGYIADPFGHSEQPIISDVAGLMIGLTKLPLVHEGEAIFHVATTASTASVAKAVDQFHQEYEQPVIKRLQ